MRLLRVQVPEFRALKDVDISFEPEFNPQVFPLGSLNGGGKSTLLQLIFGLLHCLTSRHQFIVNMLKDFEVPDGQKRIVAILDIAENNSINNKIRQMKFFCCGRNYYENYIKPLKDKEISAVTVISDDIWLLCEFEGEAEINLLTLIKRIFLISPSNQPYLFLTKEENRLLFTVNPEKTYDQVLKGLKENLPNFYTYNFIDVLTEIFRIARRKDFKERNKENPFAHTEKLENDINNLFMDGKKIVPLIIEEERHTKDEIQSVYFKLPNGTEIYPEDLSHGELKRLAIFVLIKHHQIQDSIVLFDEIESGFHPRWQRYIVDDLVEWGASNQYILATHSYEVCRGVSFGHIKEIEPRIPELAE